MRLNGISNLIPNALHHKLYISKENFSLCMNTLLSYTKNADSPVAVQVRLKLHLYGTIYYICCSLFI
jgi:hypothetical protein